MAFWERLKLPFSFSKKPKMLPSSSIQSRVIDTGYTVQTLALFELNMEKPKEYGDLPEANIKFYPFLG